MNYELEVRVPISPTPDYFRRIHFMAASLRRMEREIGAHLLVVCVGGDRESFEISAAQPWSRNYPIVWHWADREKFRRDSYWETSRDVFRQRTRGRVVMFADADVLFVRPFADLLGEINGARLVAGVIAHAPPVRGPSLGELWPQLCRAYGVPIPDAAHEYTGWDFMTADRFTPAYFNFGMVLASAGAMENLGCEIIAADEFVSANRETFFRHQIALTLAIQKLGLTTRALPLRYNFPNDPQFDQKYPGELAEVRILHYLRCEIIHRENDFRTLAGVEKLIARADLRGSNEVLRRTLSELYPAVCEEENAASHQSNRRARLTHLQVPAELQRNAPDVLADGVENTGQWLLETLAQRLGKSNLGGLELLDVGCGVRFTQTLINRRLPVGSYTGIEVAANIVLWLKEHVEVGDPRFRFVHWDVRNAMYNPDATPLESCDRLPVERVFDIVLGYSLFTHLAPPDTSHLLQLMRSAVKDDGRLFFTAFCDEAIDDFEDRLPEQPLLNALYNPSYLKALLHRAGWEIINHELPQGYMMDSFLCQPV